MICAEPLRLGELSALYAFTSVLFHSREEIETYLKYAIQQSPEPLLDLLLQKVIVYKDRIKIYMKYVGDTLSDDSPDKNDTPDGTDSVRGLLILSYSIQVNRKLPHGGRGKKTKLYNAGAGLFH